MNQQAQVSDPLTIVIVGGVAGGASAAARARRLNESAEIIMVEKNDYVSFANCGLPYYVGGEIEERDELLIATPETFLDRFRIDVRINSLAVKIDRDAKKLHVRKTQTGETYTLGYDKLILAPGATPVVPPIDGADARNVFLLRDMDDVDRITAWKDDQSPKRAVVVGAGYIGLEMVEQFSRCGIDVSLVELQPQVLPLLDFEMAEPIERELERCGVDLHLGKSVRKLVRNAEGDVTAAVLDDGRRIPADMVVLGIGVRPSAGLAKDAGLELHESGAIAVDQWMRTSDTDVYAVGDAAVYPFVGEGGGRRWIPLAGPANRSGRLAGEHAATGRAKPMPPVAGTSIVRVFELGAGVTGLTEKQANKLGLDAKALHVIAPHHAGYFPGSSPLTLKLLYAAGSGRLLGLQAVGAGGVDKRLDVAATALAAGGTVADLAGLDLAYAPPFGSAKDPLHLAAFAAENELAGVVGFVSPGENLDRYQVVDVRDKDEIENYPLPGTEAPVHIPLDDLRDRAGELDAKRPTVVVCAAGKRSYIGARILTALGFPDVKTLSGGEIVRSRALGVGRDEGLVYGETGS